MNLEIEKKDKILYEEIHLRHLNLLVDLKNNHFNNWFFKMALINTFDDLKIFISTLEKNKYKCIIAIESKKIIGYVYTYPINNKKTCLKISPPTIIKESKYVSIKELTLNLIKHSIVKNNANTSNWFISSEVNDNDLISCSRELGFQPLQEIILWEKQTSNKYFDYNKTYSYEQINKTNIKPFLSFIRSNESIVIRNLLDLDYSDIHNRTDKECGMIKNKEAILLGILKDINYENQTVYSIIKGELWNSELSDMLGNILQNFNAKGNKIVFKTSSDDKNLNSFISELNFFEIRQELILVRNTLLKRAVKAKNHLNKPWNNLIGKINPQGNAYPSPMPIKFK
tara:strand:- start:558 stop:1580 length:1023 start_codon:yes stop_codon:yes gene_type:complete